MSQVLFTSPIQSEVNNSQQQFEATEEEDTRVSGPTSLTSLGNSSKIKKNTSLDFVQTRLRPPLPPPSLDRCFFRTHHFQ